MPIGIKGFQKGHRINKGRIPWDKDKKRPEISGKNHYNWKNGRTKTPQGYILIHKPEHPFSKGHGYVYEHRLIIEKIIGCYLKPKESCHHLNEIKDDNKPQNLMAFTSENAHQRFHKNPNNVKPEEIIFDGRNTE